MRRVNRIIRLNATARNIMVRVSVDGDRVRIEVEGWDKLWAFKSHLEFPVSHVRGARVDPEPIPRVDLLGR